ncbi:RNA polymerase sigma factor [Patulibacter sp. NPDC049589]|uniref:RNA polymerase sigma factor n=1 Tax=Patulibacter sp. NPDC049589 TaxID=3154731 RepID=UPI003432962E
MPRKPPLDDAALLAGGPADYGRFYRRHEAAVLAYFLRRTGRPDVAADLTAETFVRALAGRGRFAPERGEPRGWLFGIAHNVLSTSLESGRVENETRLRLGVPALALTDDDLARIDELTGVDATAALADLPDEQREAIAARVLDGGGYDEIAAALRCSESVVRQRVSRGLRTLRTRLEDRR